MRDPGPGPGRRTTSAAPRTQGRWAWFAGLVARVSALVFVSFGVRRLPEGYAVAAQRDAVDGMAFERWLGIDGEDALQGRLLGPPFPVTVANWVYGCER